MPNPRFEAVDPPFTAFNFEVVLNLHAPLPGATSPLCSAAFAECDGLEMTMEPLTIREGGDAARQQHRMGPTSYGQLTLRRGMTANLDLWTWFLAVIQPAVPSGRTNTADGQITLSDADGTPRVVFVLEECLPVKMRGPSLHARDGQIAIEEMQLVYASLTIRPAGSAGLGASANLGVSASLGVGVSGGANLSVSGGLTAGASISVSGGPGLSGGISASASAGLDLG